MKLAVRFVTLALPALAGLVPGAAAQCELQELVSPAPGYNNRFGTAVSIENDQALVGEPYPIAIGMAHVYELQGRSWVLTAQLLPSLPGGEFGSAVSIAGDRAVVGARSNSVSGTGSGAVFVFEKQAGSWVETALLTPSDGAAGDQFGRSVSQSGDRILVGAPLDDDGVQDAGSAYVFELQGATWVETAKLHGSTAFLLDNFGGSVALDGERAFVSAPFETTPGVGATGKVYVFDKQGATWVETQQLLASDAGPNDFFGISVALDGARALIGAEQDDDLGPDSGSAYVFELAGATWLQTAKLTASDGAAQDHFGLSVALDGDKAALGARYDDDTGLNSGSAYQFELQGATWVQTGKLTAPDGAAFDALGFTVAISGDAVLVGAPFRDGAALNSGAVYVFGPGPCLFAPTPGLVGTVNTIDVEAATPGGLVVLAFAVSPGLFPVGATCPGLNLDLAAPSLGGVAAADAAGGATFSSFVPLFVAGVPLLFQAVDLAACETSNVIPFTFP